MSYFWDAELLCRPLPLQPVVGCELTNEHTNEHTNEPTNKHDGSQYFLAEVTIMVISAEADLQRGWSVLTNYAAKLCIKAVGRGNWWNSQNKTRSAWQSQTWGRPSPQVRVESQFRYSKFLSQQSPLATDSVNYILEPRGVWSLQLTVYELYPDYHPCLAARRLEKFREDTPTRSEVIWTHTLRRRAASRLALPCTSSFVLQISPVTSPNCFYAEFCSIICQDWSGWGPPKN